MTTLASKLEGITTTFNAQVPATVSKTYEDEIESAKATFIDQSGVIRVGAKFPDFTLPDATGTPVSSAKLLNKGPLLITFYRGNWCPYCNVTLHKLQERLGDIQARGVELVAISPELPDSSLTTQEKNELSFPVLSD